MRIAEDGHGAMMPEPIPSGKMGWRPRTLYAPYLARASADGAEVAQRRGGSTLGRAACAYG